MNLSALRLFVDAAKAGSFAKAAELHDLDPSLVSRRIASLERDLGFRLFQRTTRAVSLTEAGTEFLQRTEAHLLAIEDARNLGRDLTERPHGLLRVTASTSFGYEIVVPLIPKFLQSTPDVRIELLLTDRRINLIEEGVDLAVRLGSLPESGFVATKLMPIQFRIYGKKPCSRKAMPSPAELNCLTYSGGQQRTRLRVRGKPGRDTAVTLRGTVSVSNALALKRCAVLGVGPAFLPDWLVRREIATGDLIDLYPEIEFLTGDGESGAWLVYPTRIYVPSKVRRFIEFFKAELA